MEIKKIPNENITFLENVLTMETNDYSFDPILTGTVIGLVSKSQSFNSIGMTRCFTNHDNLIIETSIRNERHYMLFENIKTIIGSQIDLILMGFNNNKAIVAKVDTGASFCSLHAEDIEIAASPVGDGESVTFKYKDTTYRMPLVNKQSVQNSDGGVTYRPVVKFNIVMNNKTYEDVLFNLNDRTDMTHDILLGQNLLKQSRVLVDPTLYMESICENVVAQDINENTIKEEIVESRTEFDKFKHLTLQDVLNVLTTFNS